MSKENGKKKKTMLIAKSITTEELQEATEIMALVDAALSKRYPEIKFEYLLLWWLFSVPAEA